MRKSTSKGKAKGAARRQSAPAAQRQPPVYAQAQQPLQLQPGARTATSTILHYHSHSHHYPPGAGPATQQQVTAYPGAHPGVPVAAPVAQGQWAAVHETTVVNTNVQWYDDFPTAIAAMFDGLQNPHPPNARQLANALGGDTKRIAAKMMEFWRRFQHVPLCSGGADRTQKTILHCLAVEPHGAGPVQYLLQAKADPDCTDDLGYTPLHMAARASQAHNCHLLLQHHASPDVQDGVDMNTALHWAMLAKPRSRQVEDVLRRYGASDGIANCRGETAARLKRKPRTRAEEGVEPVYYGKTDIQINPTVKCVIL